MAREWGSSLGRMDCGECGFTGIAWEYGMRSCGVCTGHISGSENRRGEQQQRCEVGVATQNATLFCTIRPRLTFGESYPLKSPRQVPFPRPDEDSGRSAPFLSPDILQN